MGSAELSSPLACTLPVVFDFCRNLKIRKTTNF